jgi:LPS O-antigen subunit length determinant protein (WzzB/FepE family)
MKKLQFIELILTSFLFALIIANLVEILKPELWLVSALISFIIWLLGGIRYFKLKNKMFENKLTNFMN